MLKREAKTAYMREYMRRRRAGLATAKSPKPKPPWQPSQHMIEKIRYWQRVARSSRPRLRQPGHVIIDGLDLDTDEGMAEACRRYKSHRDAQHEAPKRAAVQREAAKKACWFCGEPASGDRIVIAAPAGLPLICEMCVAEAARIIADKRK